MDNPERPRSKHRASPIEPEGGNWTANCLAIRGIPAQLMLTQRGRAYQFDKQTTESGTSQSAFNVGGGIHAGYKVRDSGFELGFSYYGAYPFGVNGAHPENKWSR